MLGIGQIPFEIAIVGPKFMLVRLSLMVLLPFIAGWLAMFFSVKSERMLLRKNFKKMSRMQVFFAQRQNII